MRHSGSDKPCPLPFPPCTTHPLLPDIWSCACAGNPLSLLTGAISLTYANARLFIQVITFLRRPGLHRVPASMHARVCTDRLSFPGSYCFSHAHWRRGKTQQKPPRKAYLFWLCYTRICRHSKWQQNQSQWFMAGVQKRDWLSCFCSFFPSYPPFFCIPVLGPLRTSDESRPTCLDQCCLLLSYLLVPATFTLSSFIIRRPGTPPPLQPLLRFHLVWLAGCTGG